MVQGKLLSYNDDLSEAYRIRSDVFVKELGIPEEMEFDEFDSEAMHAIVYETDENWKENINDNKKAVATGEILFDGTDCKIDHIAVLKEYRKKNYGDFIVRLLLNKAFTAGIYQVTLITITEAEGFFRKIGFKRISEDYLEAGVLHCKMSIQLKDVITSCSIKTL